jgi:hypothetical protein
MRLKKGLEKNKVQVMAGRATPTKSEPNGGVVGVESKLVKAPGCKFLGAGKYRRRQREDRFCLTTEGLRFGMFRQFKSRRNDSSMDLSKN